MLEIIGYLAATLTTVSFLPQAIQVIKTKETKGISLSMYLIFTFGVAMWFIYGLLIMNIPILVANAITLLLSSFILYYKLREKRD